MVAQARIVSHTIKDVTVVNFEDARILDTAQIQKIGDELTNLIEKMARRKVILDFTKVQFLSSSALSVLLVARQKAVAIGGTVALCGLRKDLMKVFEIMRLDRLFSFFPDESAALKSYGVVIEA